MSDAYLEVTDADREKGETWATALGVPLSVTKVWKTQGTGYLLDAEGRVILRIDLSSDPASRVTPLVEGEYERKWLAADGMATAFETRCHELEAEARAVENARTTFSSGEGVMEAMVEAYESVRHCAIGAAPDGDGYAYYFYERVENGRGYGEETHPPIKGAEVDPGKQGNPTYPELVIRTILAARSPGQVERPSQWNRWMLDTLESLTRAMWPDGDAPLDWDERAQQIEAYVAARSDPDEAAARPEGMPSIGRTGTKPSEFAPADEGITEALTQLLGVVEMARANPPVDYTDLLDETQAKAHAALAAVLPRPEKKHKAWLGPSGRERL